MVRIWCVPLRLGAVTIIGLTAALVADGWADLLSSLLLSVPIVVIVWNILKSYRNADANRGTSRSSNRCLI